MHFRQCLHEDDEMVSRLATSKGSEISVLTTIHFSRNGLTSVEESELKYGMEK